MMLALRVVLRMMDLVVSLGVGIVISVMIVYLQILARHGRDAANLWLEFLLDRFRR
jgi:hypothetical protein